MKKVLMAALVVVSAGQAFAEVSSSSRNMPPKPAWQGALAELGPTASFKFQVRAVPDGAGGVVVAWEENRFRKACCRDLRDIYLQRFNKSGSPLWSASDYMVADEEAGEEIVGLLPGKDGGALVLWRRDSGVLLVQDVSPSGTPLLAPKGRILAPCLTGCEWNPVEAFAVEKGGRQAMAAWVETGKAPQVKNLMITGAAGSYTYSSGTSVMSGERFRAASPVSISGTGWLAVAWHVRDAGSRISGQFIDPTGNPEGRIFTVTMNDQSRWMNIECASSGRDALVLWSSINPDALGKTHEIYLTRVVRKADGKPGVSFVKLGDARTSAVYIPPVHVSLETSFTWTGQTQFENVGEDNLFWRRTSSMFPDGSGGCVVWWIEGDRIRVTRARPGDSGLVVARGFTIGSSPDIGFTPFVIPMEGKSLFLVWAEKRGRIYRVLGREISIAGQSPVPVGNTFTLQGDSAGAPRWAAVAQSGNRSAWVTLSSMTNGGNAVQIKLGKLSW
jgi:hypothetical protein